METFKETLRKIWYILYPFLFYYAVMLIIMTIAQWAFGGDATHYVFCQLIATVFTIPSMLPFYRQGQALAGIAKQPFGISRERICHALFAAASPLTLKSSQCVSVRTTAIKFAVICPIMDA